MNQPQELSQLDCTIILLHNANKKRQIL